MAIPEAVGFGYDVAIFDGASGWMMCFTPNLDAACTESGKGKKASEAKTTSDRSVMPLSRET